MTNMTLAEAIEAVKGLFEVTSFQDKQEGKSFYTMNDDGTATFFFDKRQYWRQDVIDKIVSYFQDKYIVDGQCRIDNITLLWTNVYLEKVDAHKKTPEEKEAERKEREEKFRNNWEKYRDGNLTQKDGSKIKLKDVPDEEIRAVLRRKLTVRDKATFRLFQGECMYRINKGIWTLSSDKQEEKDKDQLEIPFEES